MKLVLPFLPPDLCAPPPPPPHTPLPYVRLLWDELLPMSLRVGYRPCHCGMGYCPCHTTRPPLCKATGGWVTGPVTVGWVTAPVTVGWVTAPVTHRFVGLVVRHPPRERKIPGSNPACVGIFSGSSHTSDSKIGTPVATLPGAWRYRVSAGTGWPGVSIL